MTNDDTTEQSPAESAAESVAEIDPGSGRWQVRALLTIFAVFTGALVAIAFPAFEPTTTHDATVVSSRSNTIRRDSGRRQTTWDTELRLDDGRTVSSSSELLAKGVDSGERVEIELTNFSESVSSATWTDGEFSVSRTVALFVIAPMAGFVAFLLAYALKVRWGYDRGNALIETALVVGGFSIAAAWPFLT